MQQTGLRERKKRATRDALVQAALELFAAQGFDETSVEQIAERVDVSPRTFHRYFAGKDEVLFADQALRIEVVREALAADDGTRSVLDVLCDVVVGLASLVVSDRRRSVLRYRIIEGNDRLRAHTLRASEEIADLCAEHVARRLGLRAEDQAPRLLGMCTIGVLRTSHRRWLANPKLDLVAEVRAGFVLLSDLRGAT